MPPADNWKIYSAYATAIVDFFNIKFIRTLQSPLLIRISRNNNIIDSRIPLGV